MLALSLRCFLCNAGGFRAAIWVTLFLGWSSLTAAHPTFPTIEFAFYKGKTWQRMKYYRQHFQCSISEVGGTCSKRDDTWAPTCIFNLPCVSVAALESVLHGSVFKAIICSVIKNTKALFTMWLWKNRKLNGFYSRYWSMVALKKQGVWWLQCSRRIAHLSCFAELSHAALQLLKSTILCQTRRKLSLCVFACNTMWWMQLCAAQVAPEAARGAAHAGKLPCCFWCRWGSALNDCFQIHIQSDEMWK